jgi:hypothetical protein
MSFPGPVGHLSKPVDKVMASLAINRLASLLSKIVGAQHQPGWLQLRAILNYWVSKC